MKTAIGIISVVQEGRFRLSRDDGSSDLFFLHRFAPLEPQDLEPLAAAMARVKVHYVDVPGRVAKLVHDISIAPPAALAATNSQTRKVTP